MSPKGVKEREREKKKEERPKVGNNNGQLRIATPPRVAHTKPPGSKKKSERAGPHPIGQKVQLVKRSLGPKS